jgi:aerobic-type carbon monoxide dehydrogenase small subunit (CoxS/CutS family)
MGEGRAVTLTLRINGETREVASDPETPLIYVLRDELKLKGAKLGCGLEQCGACAVLVDGEVAMSCVSPAGSFEGKEIVTVEGVAATETGARVQAAFVEATAAQCGYCTAGLVVAVTGLLAKTPKPDRETAKRELAPHLCRCGSHPRVLRAVEIASGQA